ncbi:MAG: TetR/AcrR family transcriptional regulator [Pseudomonadota bacterium]
MAKTKDAKVTDQERPQDRTRSNILEIATREFSEKGLAGARVDEIAERTQTSKRMIYYYFESKEGLYRAVLEKVYEQIRLIESGIDIEHLSPEGALRELVQVTFDWHHKHPDFVRLVMNENIHQGEHIGSMAVIKSRRQTIIELLRKLLTRGAKEGAFRGDIDPIDLHMSISALCFYNVSNRHTFSRIFERDMTSPKAVAARREIVVETILRWCAVEAGRPARTRAKH